MSSEFTYVSRQRKKKKAVPITPTLESLQAQFEDTRTKFRASRFWAKIHDTFKNALLGIHAPENIVCLGLGSLSEGEAHRRRVSGEQLALLLELNELFKALIVAWDPVFTTLDIELLQSFDIRVENQGDEEYNGEAKTLYYLPHCDRSTNEMVLEQLVNPPSAEKSFLVLGNDFRNYRYILTDATFKAESPNLYWATQEYNNLEPDDGEEYSEAFSDLCLMWPSVKRDTKIN